MRSDPYIFATTHLYKSVSDLPREDAWILFLIVVDALFDVWRGDLGFGSADDAWSDGTRLLVAVEDLGDAAVGDAKLPRDDARTHARRRHLHDLEADVVGQWTAVDEYAPKLVHATLTCRDTTSCLQG